VFDVVCAAMIVEDRDLPVHCVGDQQLGQRLVQLPAVQKALVDGLPSTEDPRAMARWTKRLPLASSL